MLVITPAETFELDVEAPGAQLSPGDLASQKRHARVALRLAVIEMWEQDQSPLALNRR